MNKQDLELVIQSAASDVLDQIKAKLGEKWLDVHASEINLQAETILYQKKKKHAQSYCGKLNTKESNNVSFGGVICPREHAQLFSTSKSEIQEKVAKKYIQDFEKSIWPELQKQMVNALEKLGSENIINLFLQRHDWLASERIVPSFIDQSVNYKMMHTLFYQHLTEHCTSSINNWEFTEPNQFKTHYQWNKFPEEKLKNLIEDLPYRKIRDIYCEHIPNLPNFRIATRRSSDYISNCLYYSVQRVDIFHYFYLANQYALFETSLIDKLHTPKIAAYRKDELKHLTNSQWAHYEFVFINTKTEEDPLWILMHKSGKTWNIYVDDVAVSKGSCMKFLENIPEVSREKVNFVTVAGDNAKISDLAIDKEMTWHAILFGKIIPWCLLEKDSRPKLHNYRTQIPLPVLLQYMLTQFSDLSTKRQVRDSFKNRSPLTNKQIYQLNNGTQTDYLFAYDRNADFNPDLNRTIDTFDKAGFKFTDNNTTLTIKPDAVQNEIDAFCLHDALALVYYHNIKTLFLCKTNNYRHSTHYPTIIANESLFDYNLSLLSINPNIPKHDQDKDTTRKPMMCAARNRFLAAVAPERISVWSEVKNRRNIWQDSAREIFDFLQRENELTIDFINKLTAFNKQWVNNSCDHNMHDKTDKNIWAFAQICQMGTKGLDNLSSHLSTYPRSWNNIHKKPAPKLPFVYDVSHNYWEEPHILIDRIVDLITQFDQRNTGCSPLFQKLELIVPPSLNDETSKSICGLFEALDARFKSHPDEISQISLYNLDLLKSEPLLEALEQRVKENRLCIMLRVPQWDVEQYNNPNEKKIIARYRQLQNSLQNNKKYLKNKLLTENTQNINKESSVKESVDLERLIREEQSFSNNQTIYPLATQTPGIQQQLQQEIGQNYEMQQEEEQEQEQEEEQEQELQAERYFKDENELITRDNIEDKYRTFWNKLNNNTKRSGISNEDSLSKLFSLWVGSDEDAPLTYAKIEPRAVEKMMQHCSHFLFGLQKETPPPGFYTARSRIDGKLILCFDENREKEELLKRDNLPAKKLNPYRVILNENSKRELFAGDYRQFNELLKHTNPSQFPTLWRYLAHENISPKRLQNMNKVLGDISPDTRYADEDKSALLQYHTVENKLQAPGFVEDCLNLLLAWANKVKENPLNTKLFSTTSDYGLSEHNLKSFGQLFNTYENTDSPLSAGLQWLTLCHRIHDTFGEAHFAVWKRRLLDPCNDFSICLERREVDAVVNSIDFLNQRTKVYTKCWWQLVDAHGAAVGEIRYHQLWDAYARIIQLLEKHEVEINEEILTTFLRETQNFNGQVFLDRLHKVLHSASRELDASEIMRNVLNNLEKVEWRYNGLYYANHFANYKYWDNELKLEKFYKTTNTEELGYDVKWDNNNEAITDSTTHALRFAATRAKLSYGEFQALKNLLNNSQLPKDKPKAATRLLSACLALGFDNASKLKVAKIQQGFASLPQKSMDWINSAIALDLPITHYSLHLRFEHAADLAQTLNQLDVLSELNSIHSTPEKLSMLNMFGHSLSFIHSNLNTTGITLKSLIEPHKKHLSARQFMITTYPWLAGNSKELTELESIKTSSNWNQSAIVLFEKQLQSIDFQNSTWLPNFTTVKDALSQLSAAYSPAPQRNELIKTWIEKGLCLRESNADYRALDRKEVKNACNQLEKSLKPYFKEQNLTAIKKLLSNHIAVPANGDALRHLAGLFTSLKAIDNKPHYDELGIVLGALLHASQNPNRYYNCKQLERLLNSFTQAKNYNDQHFQTNILETILKFAPTKLPELLNNDLNRLSHDSRSEALSNTILRISQSTLDTKLKAKLVNLVFESPQKIRFLDESGIKQLEGTTASISPLVLAAMVDNVDYFIDREMNTKLQIFTTNPLDEHRVSKPMLHAFAKSQVKLLKLATQNILTFNELDDLFYCSPFAQISFCESFNAPQDLEGYIRDNGKKNLDEFIKTIKRKEAKELLRLTEYMITEPRPSLAVLKKIIDQPVNDLIFHFESVIQAQTPAGVSKRTYSITDKDHKNLLRILTGFRQKGESGQPDKIGKPLMNMLYYCNEFSLATGLHKKTHDELLQLLENSQKTLQTTLGQETKQRAAAQILAVMREVMLRKTGKWANHTQMLVLLHAALHNDESLLHQVRTGEGKSIITVMRVSYMALSGYNVDVFSAKESLSERDHEEFEPVLNALNIDNAYIRADSPATAYKTGNAVTGAVNYATPGNLSLYLNTHNWQGANQIVRNPAKMAAYLDECDYLLFDEKTQYNYATGSATDIPYNLDAWAYRVVYKYYLENKDKFDQRNGIPYVKVDPDFKALCKKLQESSKTCPKDSTFFQTWMIPALTGDAKAIEKRDRMLKQLLTAAHIASGLTEGINYSVRPEPRQIGNKVFASRFAKVVIENQIYHGSTYSDLVQQFLHVRLNAEAVQKGEKPDFFVEPVTEISLSQNAENLFTQDTYSLIGGCTGTGGKPQDEIQQCKKMGIDQVIKVPTHLEVRTHFAAAQYPDTEEATVQAWVKKILENSQRPILITCENDIAVKRIGTLIQNEIKRQKSDYDFSKFITDTNDSGKPEKDILPLAGKIGAVTISSRLGRGSDIKPETGFGINDNNQPQALQETFHKEWQTLERKLSNSPVAQHLKHLKDNQNAQVEYCFNRAVKKYKRQKGIPDGLLVIRTYISTLRKMKQEIGRQGRNNRDGEAVDIVNFAPYEKYMQSPNTPARLKQIIREQTIHLQEKLEKHRQKGSKKWSWMENDTTLQQRHVITRSVAQYRQEQKQQSEAFLRSKEKLVAILSTEVNKVLNDNIGNKFIREPEQFKESWLEARRQIESRWTTRLAGGKQDSPEVFNLFVQQATQIWTDFCKPHRGLNPSALDALKHSKPMDENKLEQWIQTTKSKWENTNLTQDNSPELKKDKKQCKDYLLIYHPDKNKNNDSNTVRQLNDLFGVLRKKEQEDKNNQPKDFHATTSLNVNMAPENSNSSRGAIISINASKVPVSKPDLKSRHPEFSALLRFYQAWLNGAIENVYSPHLDDNGRLSKPVAMALHGKREQELLKPDNYFNQFDGFYKMLQKVSQHNTHGNLAPDLQAQRLTQMFTQLATLVEKNKNVYTINYSTWATYFKLLAQLTPTACDKILLENTETFFNQTIITKPLKDRTLEVEIKNRSLLFKWTFQILAAAQVNDNTLSNQFVTNMGAALHTYQWKNLPDIENELNSFIEKLVKEKRVAALLVQHTSRDDIERLIELALRHPQRQSDLIDYCKDNFKAINKRPELLNSIISLYLAPEQNEVPSMASLAKAGLDDAQQVKFIQFLNQRHPVTPKAVEKLLRSLDTVDKKIYLKQLFAIPQHISLEHINTTLAPHFGKHKTNTFEQKIKAMQLFSDNLIAVDKIKNDTLRIEVIKAFNNDKFKNPEELGMVTDFCQTLERSTKVGDARVLAASIKLIQSDFKQELISLLNSKLPDYADKNDSEDINILESAAMDRDRDVLQAYFTIREQLKDYPILQSRFITAKPSSESNKKYQKIIKVLQDDTYSELKPEMKNKIIKKSHDYDINASNLRNAFKTAKTALKLERDKNYSNFFGKNFTENQDKVSILQALQHNLIDLGDEFKRKCFDNLGRLAASILDKFPQQFIKTKPAEMKKAYHGIISLSHGLSEISRHPFDNSPAEAKEHDELQSVNALNKYITQQNARYEACWFKSKHRVAQAKQLFNKLEGMDPYSGYSYQSLLNSIWQTQKDILKNDSISKNLKGYSRLYNISSEMFLTVAKAYLNDPDAQKNTVFLQNLFKEQLLFHLETLSQKPYLSGEIYTPVSELCLAIRENRDVIKPETDEMIQLRTLLNSELKKDKLSRHLHYLVDIIDNVAAFSEDATPLTNWQR